MKRLIVAFILGAGGVASASVSAQQALLANAVVALPMAVDFPGSDAANRVVGATNCDEADALPTTASTPPRGGDDASASSSRSTTPSSGAGTQAVSAPHRPTYRWQSLVPGAIK